MPHKNEREQQEYRKALQKDLNECKDDVWLGDNYVQEQLKKEVNVKDTGGVKHDQDKLRYDLIPVFPLQELARVYTIGGKKYAPYNWRKGMDFSRIIGAMFRHIELWRSGERYDKENGQSHLAAAAWNAFTLMEYEEFGLGNDDRIKTAVEEKKE